MLNLIIIYFLLALGIFVLPKPIKSKKGIFIAVVQLAAFIWFAIKIQLIATENPETLFVNWIPELGLNIEFLLDGLSMAFALLVSGIGALVFLYAHSYMKSYNYTDKFFFFLFLFSGAMLGMVLSSNLIQLFIFWEFTTVLSFFLISFFHEKEVARKAAFQSLVITFFGGLGLLAGILLIGSVVDSYSLNDWVAGSEKIIMKNIRSEMKKMMDDLVFENVKSVEMLIEKGNPIEQVSEIAEKREMNLIVIGEGNHSENEHFKLGSNTERMMQKNEIPLMVVKNEPVKQIKKILCPVDFSESSKRALANAIFLSNRFGAQLTILNVFTPVEVFSYWIDVNNKKENQLQLQQQKAEFDDFMKNFHINKDFHFVKIAPGEPEEEILKEIKNQGIDLLMMGTTGKTALSKIFLGSVTEKVTREVPCNFIITSEAEISNEIFESNLKNIESLIVAARNHFDNDEIEKAIEKFMHVLNHHPDSVPALVGLMQCYRKTGNQQKANLFRDYARKVINRIWGTEFSSLHDLLS